MSARRPGSSGPARRAVLRWSARLFRREWRQMVLVLALMTVAVAAAVAAATMVSNAAAASDADFGAATSMAKLDATRADVATAQLAAARQRFGDVEVITHRMVAIPGSAAPLDERSQDPAAPFGRPLLALRSGRYPTQADEVALTPATARLLSAHVGDTIQLGTDSSDPPLLVVGLVENPTDLSDEFALIPPDEHAPADSLTLLFDSSRREGTTQQAGASGPADFPVMGKGDPGPVTPLVLVATTLAMALVGLIAAAGFVVVAQRRQRQLGLLAASGATERHLRLVMVGTGAIVGIGAALMGAALGTVGWILTAPAVEVAVGHRIDRFDLPWATIAMILALAVATATLAAWWPARGVARQPVMVALSGRPTPPLPVRRSVVVAVAFTAGGMWAISASHPFGGEVQPLLFVAGTVAVVIGVVAAAPAAIRVVAAPAARFPFAARLALRDLARFQSRAAAALAAITLTLGLSIAVVGIAQANEYRSDEGNLSSRQVLIRLGEGRSSRTPAGSQDGGSDLDGRVAAVAAAVPDATVLPLAVAVNPRASDAGQHEPVGEVVQEGPYSIRLVDHPAVATPEVLARFGIDPATIDDATDLLTNSKEDVQLADIGSEQRGPMDTVVQRVDLPTYTSGPTALITEAAMRRNGWVATRSSWLVDAPHALTTDQIAAARAAAAPLGLTIETRTSQDALATVRTVATSTGIVLALATLLMTIGLIRSEGARDLRTLTATGASPRTRRALTATTAGVLTLVGVVLGAVGAYLALVAAYHTDLGKLVPLPLVDLLLIAVGLPLAATAIGWLLAGREPRTFSRQALE